MGMECFLVMQANFMALKYPFCRITEWCSPQSSKQM